MQCSTVSAAEFNRGTWLTIDPGVNTGVARWKNGDMTGSYTKKLNSYNMRTLFLQIQNGLDILWRCPAQYTGVIIEGVEFYPSPVSYASGVKGDLSLLAYIVGAISYLYAPMSERIEIISPRKWKAQLNYKQLRNILQKKFRYIAPNDHVAAAAGMGYWAKGEL